MKSAVRGEKRVRKIEETGAKSLIDKSGSCSCQELHEHVGDKREGNDDRADSKYPKAIKSVVVAFKESESLIERRLG